MSHVFITCEVGAWRRYQQITCYGKLVFQQKDAEAASGAPEAASGAGCNTILLHTCTWTNGTECHVVGGM
jgi:hypothetical protein